MTTPTRALARFAAGLRPDDLPPAVVDHLKLCILDAVGCGLFGSGLPWARTGAELLHNVQGPGGVTVWGSSLKLSPVDAALANGTAVHSFELDDTHAEGIQHLGSGVLPAVAAMAEHLGGVAGPAFLAATAVGYEVAIRVGMTIGIASALRGFHVPAVAAPFGAAAGVGAILRLDEEQMVNALGLAGGMAAGLQGSQYGAMGKRLQLGRAAQAGVLAALLAQRGFTGMAQVLDDVEYGGFLQAFAGDYDIAALTEGLGQRYEVANVGFKPHSCSRSNHTTLDALADIRRLHPDISADTVEEVVVRCSTVTYRYGAFYDIQAVTGAQLSLPYCAAVMLRYGEVFVDQFNPDTTPDPELVALAQRMRLIPDPDIDRLGRPGRYRVEVQVTLKDGRQFTGRAEHPRGSPQNPMSVEDLQAKFRLLAGRRLAQRHVEQVLEDIMALEKHGDAGAVFTRLGLCG